MADLCLTLLTFQRLRGFAQILNEFGNHFSREIPQYFYARR
jgi:hypothetical protein